MTARRLPGPRGGQSLAAARRLLRDPAPELDRLTGRWGPVVGLGGGPLRIAVVGGAEEVAELLAMPADRFRWNHRMNVLHFVVGPGSLLVSDGDDHRRRRGAVVGSFARRRLDGWIPTIVSQVDRVAGHIVTDAECGAGDVIDLTPHCRDLAIGVITETILGASLAPRAGEIGERFARPQAYLESPAVRQIPHRIPFTRRARVRQDRRALDRIIDEEVAVIRAGGRHGRTDALADMVHAGDLDDDEIRDQVVTLIGAGYDTTSAALAWTLWRAASHPGLWDRLRAEADGVLPHPTPDRVREDDDALDGRTLAALDLAGRTVREALRLHPAGLGGVREAAVDVAAGAHTIPAGTLILWSAYLTGRDPSVWPDPLSFDPDRFMDLTPAQRAAADRAWVPFGGGARACIGFALAQMELTFAVSRLSQLLDLTPAHGRIPAPRGLVVNRPAGGVPFRVTARDPDAGTAVEAGEPPGRRPATTGWW